MSSKKSKSSPHLDSINTIIGEGTSFRGDFDLNGSMRIDGTFTGKIKSRSKVIIGPKGIVKTNIEALHVVVAGEVNGNIYADESVYLMDSANVNGDIISKHLVVEEGVKFDGRAKVNSGKTS